MRGREGGRSTLRARLRLARNAKQPIGSLEKLLSAAVAQSLSLRKYLA